MCAELVVGEKVDMWGKVGHSGARPRLGIEQ